MKILITTGLYPPDVGGPATYVKLLEKELPRKGFSVVVYPFSKVRHYPKLLRHVVYLFGVIQYGKNADMVYAQDPVSVGFSSMLAAKVLRKPLVLKVVGDYAWEQGVQRFGVKDSLDEFVKNKSSSPIMVRALKAIEYTVAKNAKKIIVPSIYLKNIVKAWGINEHKIRVVYNAFSTPHIEKTKEELRKSFRLDGNIVLSAGRLVPWKGFEKLIGAISKISKGDSSVTLLLAGSGPLYQHLQHFIYTLGVNDRVKLLGSVSHETLLEYVKAADIFVLNTAYEGLSHQLLEVMALGTPIITTRAGGNTELLKDKESGLLVEYNNQKEIEETIKKLLNDEPVRRKLSENAKEKAGEFTEERLIQETIKQLS